MTLSPLVLTASPGKPIVSLEWWKSGDNHSLGTVATHRPIVPASGLEQWWSDNWLGETAQCHFVHCTSCMDFPETDDFRPLQCETSDWLPELWYASSLHLNKFYHNVPCKCVPVSGEWLSRFWCPNHNLPFLLFMINFSYYLLLKTSAVKSLNETLLWKWVFLRYTMDLRCVGLLHNLWYVEMREILWILFALRT